MSSVGVGFRLASRFKNLFGLETKSGLAAPEAWLSELFAGQPAASGISVTPKVAMTCAPVRAAVQAISEAIGQLPVHVYRRDGDGKERDPIVVECSDDSEAAYGRNPQKLNGLCSTMRS